jgi:UDPglucose 6-dehydrogenase
MLSIGVVGNGFVGGSLTTCFSERGLDVYVYDKAGKVATGGKTLSKVEGAYGMSLSSVTDLVRACELEKNFSNVFFVCLPTPMREDGSCDLSIVEGVLDELASVPGDRIAVVKSTVPPGTTKHWNEKYIESGLSVVFNPEFLREATALDDMRNQDRIILGGPKKAVNKVRDLYQSAFPDVDIHKTSSTNAELVKYTINTFLATKVSFANEISQICEKLDHQKLDVDYDRVIELATLDKRLGTSHWKVPGPDGKLGFGLSCFPKDINSLITVAKKLNVKPTVLSAAWEKNLEVRPGKDWELLIGRAVSKKEK